MSRKRTRTNAIDDAWERTSSIHRLGAQSFQSEEQDKFAAHLGKFFSTDRERLSLRAVDALADLLIEAYEIGRKS